MKYPVSAGEVSAEALKSHNVITESPVAAREVLTTGMHKTQLDGRCYWHVN